MIEIYNIFHANDDIDPGTMEIVRAGLAPAPITLTPPEVDAVLLYDKPRIMLADLYKKIRFKSVIAASGGIRDWETECIENNIPFFNLQKSNYLNIPI